VDSTGGITMGTDTYLYRSTTNTLALGSNDRFAAIANSTADTVTG